MWLKFTTLRQRDRVGDRRVAGRIVVSILTVSVMMATGGATAKEPACPPSAAPQTNVQPRAKALKDIQALPNKPNPKVEGSVVVTEGYLIRAISVHPTVSRCGARVERSYQFRLLPKKPTSLKGRFSFRHAVVATVPAKLVEGRLDANGAPIALTGKRVRVSGMLTFAATSREKLNKTQGSLWELVAVTDVTPCSAETCSAAGP